MASMLPAMFRVRLSPAVGWRTFFSEEYFWKEANIGPFFWALALSPFAFAALKEAYWTRQTRALCQKEIISDRYVWLHKAMLDDEVAKAVLKK